uniref:Uncharacterized protein n=1 Tax=Arion vulgaris TaxID=1028688 RepID=A0A0B7BUL4_9EUPU
MGHFSFIAVFQLITSIRVTSDHFCVLLVVGELVLLSVLYFTVNVQLQKLHLFYNC